MDAYASLGIKAELPISITNALDQINETVHHAAADDDSDYVPGEADAASDSSSEAPGGSDDTLVDSIEHDAPKSTPPTSPTLAHCDVVGELHSSPPPRACASPSPERPYSPCPDTFARPSPSPARVRSSMSRGVYYSPTSPSPAPVRASPTPQPYLSRYSPPAPVICPIEDEDELAASQLQAEMEEDEAALGRKRKYAAVAEYHDVPGYDGTPCHDGASGSGGAGDPASKRCKLLASLLELVGECEAVASWTAEEQREAGELAFRLQAAVRGWVPRPQGV